MTSILSEKEYQHFIMDRLSLDNGYIVRKATSYDRLFAMDRELLFQFLNDTQPDEMAALRKIYKADLEDTLVNFINAEVTKDAGGGQGPHAGDHRGAGRRTEADAHGDGGAGKPAGCAEARHRDLQHEAGTHVYQTRYHL